MVLTVLVVVSALAPARIGFTVGERSISMFFIKVPEAKSTKNRGHLDLHADDRQAAVEHLVSLGATRLAGHDEWGVRWTTLADVEGNEFCVASGNPS